MTTSVTPAVLTPTTPLTTTAVTYISGAVGAQTIIRLAVFSNVTAGAITVTAWRVAAGTATTANMIIPPRSIAANATYLAAEMNNLVLNAGESVQCSASAAASVNFTASGFVAT